MKKDTVENRLRAIEAVVGGDYGMDAEWYSHFSNRRKKLSREKLEEYVEEFGKMITICYLLAHGGNSECCKGKGKEYLEILGKEMVKSF